MQAHTRRQVSRLSCLVLSCLVLCCAGLPGVREISGAPRLCLLQQDTLESGRRTANPPRKDRANRRLPRTPRAAFTQHNTSLGAASGAGVCVHASNPAAGGQRTRTPPANRNLGATFCARPVRVLPAAGLAPACHCDHQQPGMAGIPPLGSCCRRLAPHHLGPLLLIVSSCPGPSLTACHVCWCAPPAPALDCDTAACYLLRHSRRGGGHQRAPTQRRGAD
jgi:hypothetical protein